MCNFFPLFSSILLPILIAGSGASAGGPVATSADDNNDVAADNESTNGSESNPPPEVATSDKTDQDGDVTMPTLESLEPSDTNG